MKSLFEARPVADYSSPAVIVIPADEVFIESNYNNRDFYRNSNENVVASAPPKSTGDDEERAAHQLWIDRNDNDTPYNPNAMRLASSSSPYAHLREKPASFWVLLSISFIICAAFWAVSLYFCIQLVFLDQQTGGRKPFQSTCFTPQEMRDHLCLFSAGLVSYGIVSIGEVSVGLISLGQVGIGLLVAVGQAMGGCGWSVGQIASGWFVYGAQVGVGLYRVYVAQMAVQCFGCLREVDEGREDPQNAKPLVLNKGCG